MVRRVRVTVHGRVQGVGFRAAVVHAAHRLPVAGFVRNAPDGTVQAEVEGEPDAVEALVAVLREGPVAAGVSSVDVSEVPARGETGFRVTG
ncbi:acylphosphatase [Myceligenerans indicum]|uniref:Acylphosphatase n=1 Tax=Myceligenerans indicum TaxID=2593663 RepID=A0ABS1LQB8_9MICO|nr:acylphosphatase [Myceligenerans indicum]MBL0888466.1 acylphosphatase [Myceligenerans indicum]